MIAAGPDRQRGEAKNKLEHALGRSLESASAAQPQRM
jgi:hypothetical protein